MTIQATEFSWEQLLEAARNNTSARRVRRLGHPSSAAIIAIDDGLFKNCS